MKERKLEMQCQEKQHMTRWKVLPTVALLWALLWSPSETFAQKVSDVNDGVTTEVVQKDSTSRDFEMMCDSWIGIPWDDWTSIELEWVDWMEKSKWKDDKSWIDIHGMVQVWSWVAPEYADVWSDKATLTAMLDVSHRKSWLGFTVIRMDDFHDDPSRPASRVTVLNPHWTKTFWKEGQWRVSLEWKYAFIDHLPEANWFSPDIVWSYTTKGWWILEWMYGHKFQKGSDSDAFRLSVSKKMSEALKITAQWWYETWYDKHFYGRVILDVDLWDGFGIQLSCIMKDWKLTPTTWLMYLF